MSLEVRGALALWIEDCVSGIGVLSMLGCVVCVLATDWVGFGAGGM